MKFDHKLILKINTKKYVLLTSYDTNEKLMEGCLKVILLLIWTLRWQPLRYSFSKLSIHLFSGSIKTLWFLTQIQTSTTSFLQWFTAENKTLWFLTQVSLCFQDVSKHLFFLSDFAHKLCIFFDEMKALVQFGTYHRM